MQTQSFLFVKNNVALRVIKKWYRMISDEIAVLLGLGKN